VLGGAGGGVRVRALAAPAHRALQATGELGDGGREQQPLVHADLEHSLDLALRGAGGHQPDAAGPRLRAHPGEVPADRRLDEEDRRVGAQRVEQLLVAPVRPAPDGDQLRAERVRDGGHVLEQAGVVHACQNLHARRLASRFRFTFSASSPRSTGLTT
jgi:hypothetical protein